MIGTIKVLKEGFGFIKSDDVSSDVFFHANSLEGASFNDLEEGNKVSFEIGDGKNGKKQWINIKLV